jgi:hypothetical protein
MAGEVNGPDVVIEELNRRSKKQIERQEWKNTFLKSTLRDEPNDGIVQGAYYVDGGLQRCEDHLQNHVN